MSGLEGSEGFGHRRTVSGTYVSGVLWGWAPIDTKRQLYYNEGQFQQYYQNCMKNPDFPRE